MTMYYGNAWPRGLTLRSKYGSVTGTLKGGKVFFDVQRNPTLTSQASSFSRTVPRGRRWLSFLKANTIFRLLFLFQLGQVLAVLMAKGLSGLVLLSAYGPLAGLFALTFLLAAGSLIGIFRWHGAEHKVINAVEQHGDAWLLHAREASRVHARCGTNLVVYLTLFNALFSFVLHPSVAAMLGTILGIEMFTESSAQELCGQKSLGARVGAWAQKYLSTQEPTPMEMDVACLAMIKLQELEPKR